MLNIKRDINQQHLTNFDHNFVKTDFFQLPEVVDRVSETQIQVGKNSK